MEYVGEASRIGYNKTSRGYALLQRLEKATLSEKLECIRQEINGWPTSSAEIPGTVHPQSSDQQQ